MKATLICIALAMSLSACAETIYIQPLGNVDKRYVDAVVSGIETFYRCRVVVRPPVPLTPDLLAASGTRYEASHILSKFNSRDEVVLITEKDIACKNEKRHSNEWGVFGLGYQPGNTCVISTYRIRKGKEMPQIKDRLIKVCLHEIGHNKGLPHCGTPGCMMNDADATIVGIDTERVWFCDDCTSKLK